MVEFPVGEAGAQEGFLELGALADPDTPVIEEGAPALGGGEELVPVGVVYHRLGDLAVVGQGDGNGVLGEAVDEVGGAVQGVDNPLEFRIAGPGQAALFC